MVGKQITHAPGSLHKTMDHAAAVVMTADGIHEIRTKEMEVTEKGTNLVMDVIKGFAQVITWQGGIFGFMSGSIYGAINGFQTCKNNDIDIQKTAGKYIGVMLTAIAGSGLAGTVWGFGPSLIGMVGSAVDQVVTKSVGSAKYRTLSLPEFVISGIPLVGPIWAGRKRDEALRYLDEDPEYEEREAIEDEDEEGEIDSDPEVPEIEGEDSEEEESGEEESSEEEFEDEEEDHRKRRK